MSRPFLPYGRQVIDEDDIAAVAAVLRGDYLTTGPAVTAFEAAFAEVTGAAHAIAAANGTAALHLTTMALGLGPGDAAIVPSLTFLATANAARYVGAEVVFADVDPDTGLLDADRAAAAVDTAIAAGLRPRALFPVYLNGPAADPINIAALARDRGLAVVADGCHGLGTTYAPHESRAGENTPRAVGGCADVTMTTFSFHPVKTIAMGEGGAITTNDPVLAERLARTRNHGMTRDADRFQITDQAIAPDGDANPWYYEMPEVGFNYRASDIHCALGLSQLRKLDHFAARRRTLIDRYRALLRPLAPHVRLAALPAAHANGSVTQDPVMHLAAALIDFDGLGTDRATVMKRLRAEGVGTQVHYLPVHRQPYYRDRYGLADLPGADAYYARELSLPLFPTMADTDVDRVVETLAGVLGLS